jgi:hypothetical protein
MATYGNETHGTTFADMVGEIMVKVTNEGGERLVFDTATGKRFVFYYEPDCCANCSIEDVCGDLADLEGSPIVEAEEVSNYEREAPPNADSYTWTFYRFSTAKGTVTVRWLGESNGYYSESVTYSVAASSEGEREKLSADLGRCLMHEDCQTTEALGRACWLCRKDESVAKAV